jgi:hypothetical protein
MVVMGLLCSTILRREAQIIGRTDVDLRALGS